MIVSEAGKATCPMHVCTHISSRKPEIKSRWEPAWSTKYLNSSREPNKTIFELTPSMKRLTWWNSRILIPPCRCQKSKCHHITSMRIAGASQHESTQIKVLENVTHENNVQDCMMTPQEMGRLKPKCS